MDNKYITLSHLDQTVWSLVQKINQIKDSIKFEETDPVFLASAASQITAGDIQQWNGLLNSPAAGITQTDVQVWDNAADMIFSNNYMIKGTDYVTAGQKSGTNLGSYATAEGINAQASGECSHAEGYFTTASGSSSHAEGSVTIAEGDYSHASGYRTLAIGESSHAEGYGDISASQYYVTLSSTDSSTDTFTCASTPLDTFKGCYIKTTNDVFAYIKSINTDNNTVTFDKALTVSQVTDTQKYLYKNTAIGNYSHVEGHYTTALGEASHVEGYLTAAEKDRSHAEGSGSIASGQISHAEGRATIASGDISHAEGWRTIASGEYSHAEGHGSVASGISAHAENGKFNSTLVSLTGSELSYTTSDTLQRYYVGKNIGASGARITEINNQTITVDKTLGTLTNQKTSIYIEATLASGNYSHAEGLGTIASGEGAHAEGGETLASGKYAHSGGYDTVASGNYSYTEGLKTQAMGIGSHSEGGYTLAIGDYSHAEGGDSFETQSLSLTGSGTTYTVASAYVSYLKPYFIGKMIQSTDSFAVITGYDKNASTITLDKSLGELTNVSCKVQLQTVASGTYSHAEGALVTAEGSYSHAEGFCTKASNSYSHAEGNLTVSRGQYSHAEGHYSVTEGSYSHAEGERAYSIGMLSHAEGKNTAANGIAAHAEGCGIITGLIIRLTGSNYTYSVNTNVAASWIGSVVVKNDNIYSFITAVDTTNNTITLDSTLFSTLTDYPCNIYPQLNIASGDNSHVEGYATRATAESAHAEGAQTLASGGVSHAEGRDTISSGSYSHAEGYNTIASGRYQHAAGKYNIEDTNNTYAEIIGIGTEEHKRANGRTLDWSGNEVLAGKLTVGAGPTENMDVATKLYVDTIITVEPMSNVEAMLTELGLDASASLTPATVPAQTNHAVVQEG